VERIAITGPPASGKSALVRALGGDPLHPKHTHTVYSLEDELLVHLAEAEGSAKITPVKISFEEIELGSHSSLRDCDCMVVVVRPPSDADAPSAATAAADLIEDIDTEMILADLGLIEGATKRLQKVAASGDQHAKRVVAAAEGLTQALEARDLATAASIASDPSSIPKEWALLCQKPRVVVVNVGEDQADQASTIEEILRRRLGDETSAVLASLLEIESELQELSAEDRSELAASYRIEVPIAQRLSQAVLDALGSIVFYTANENEARAWTLKQGSTALQAAARIHSDLERGFIRAEVIAADKLLEIGSMKDARASGAVRTEGKGYLVQPNDVLYIRFNV
jgi:ribosome-binding ATPase YchF (GTP1/OBG family)